MTALTVQGVAISAEQRDAVLAAMGNAPFRKNYLRWRLYQTAMPERMVFSSEGKTAFLTIEMGWAESREIDGQISRFLQSERRAGRIRHTGGGWWERVA